MRRQEVVCLSFKAFRVRGSPCPCRSARIAIFLANENERVPEDPFAYIGAQFKWTMDFVQMLILYELVLTRISESRSDLLVKPMETKTSALNIDPKR
jgi:hypothetical protein